MHTFPCIDDFSCVGTIEVLDCNTIRVLESKWEQTGGIRLFARFDLCPLEGETYAVIGTERQRFPSPARDDHLKALVRSNLEVQATRPVSGWPYHEYPSLHKARVVIREVKILQSALSGTVKQVICRAWTAPELLWLIF